MMNIYKIFFYSWLAIIISIFGIILSHERNSYIFNTFCALAAISAATFFFSGMIVISKKFTEEHDKWNNKNQ